jgi:hypothetical protein
MRHLAVLFALAAAACGGSTSGITSADVQRFNATAQDVSTAATTSGAQAGGMTDAASCSTAQNGYDAQARPMVGRLQSMGAGMDGEMGSMHHASDADMACAANAMMAELDRHRAVACASTVDMTTNKAEAQHHVAAMTQWADHEMARSDEMASMMGMGMGGMGGTGTTTGHCVRNADGSYTMQP